ncbi:hypothetical protein IWQ62_001228 [Dispira parvispora]|uniref:Uncharacterized protein n=1 Tax=Dispira parvispora TaxID=1520584 RepID=A0A9W8E9A9_9FUNG|nr:hypothetical protein IWQ62_001228 [Dispira parvispora]
MQLTKIIGITVTLLAMTSLQSVTANPAAGKVKQTVQNYMQKLNPLSKISLGGKRNSKPGKVSKPVKKIVPKSDTKGESGITKTAHGNKPLPPLPKSKETKSASESDSKKIEVDRHSKPLPELPPKKGESKPGSSKVLDEKTEIPFKPSKEKTQIDIP